MQGEPGSNGQAGAPGSTGKRVRKLYVQRQRKESGKGESKKKREKLECTHNNDPAWGGGGSARGASTPPYPSSADQKAQRYKFWLKEVKHCLLLNSLQPSQNVLGMELNQPFVCKLLVKSGEAEILTVIRFKGMTGAQGGMGPTGAKGAKVWYYQVCSKYG